MAMKYFRLQVIIKNLSIFKITYQMNQGGVTDLATAKGIARKLYASYGLGGSFERGAMEKMMIDTYKILNKQYRPSNQDLNVYGSVLDFNGDGKITVQDFESLAIKYLVKPDTRNYTKKVRQRLEVAQRLFRQFDTDNDGFLGQRQIPNILRQTYKMMGTQINPTQQDVRSWMEMTDQDGDGKVTLQDYQRLIVSSLERVGIKIYERQ